MLSAEQGLELCAGFGGQSVLFSALCCNPNTACDAVFRHGSRDAGMALAFDEVAQQSAFLGPGIGCDVPGPAG